MVESDDAGDTWSKPSRIEYKYVGFDRFGNWSMRKSHNGTEERFLVYYDNPKRADHAGNDFLPWDKDYVFSGTIGAEKKRPFGISKHGGIYCVLNGTRHTEVVAYDQATAELTVGALRATDDKKLGEFKGKVSREADGKLRYKGTFTNINGGSVAFDLVSL